ncbi:hypothetical protein CBR64_09595 [Cellulosimicrobium cellulans]|uniref:Insertion element IS402-like domain-containing protein n=1 Tax=Cellulosimicrobium cellulans TaxID=1710 RepID=A0A1Y0HU50_CELCE|nr:transposase [Cellulosimicrobium cellulans]ARU51698.1 hypothetical protein CBR64_09595 [Cellulosimicrobium cellulans]
MAGGLAASTGDASTQAHFFFDVTTGIPWRALPHDFTVSWSAAHKHFTRWTNRRL